MVLRGHLNPRHTTVFVIGVAHCGSTLFGRLLDMHPRVHCVGEVLRLFDAIDKDMPCGCGAAIARCPFWSAELQWLKPGVWRLGPRFRTADFERLARAAGKEIVLDLSKSLAWRRGRFHRSPNDGFVFLVRDSRGALASIARKGKPLEPQLARHVKQMKRYQAFVDRHAERSLVVRYEDLCRTPRTTLERVCAWLGIEFDERCLRPADQVHHFVHSSTSGYLKGTNEIKLDERWHEVWSPADLARIETAMRGLPSVADLVRVEAPRGE
jgi:hypothetical protein